MEANKKRNTDTFGNAVLDVCFIFLCSMSPFMVGFAPVSTALILICGIVWFAARFLGYFGGAQ